MQEKTKSGMTLGGCLIVAALLSACATPQPVPFELVDSNNKVHQGTFLADNQHMEALINGKLYQGFYVYASGVATNTDPWVRYGRYGPYGGFGTGYGGGMTVINSNNARGHLSSVDGDRLNCEFISEGSRVVGECKSAQGKTYQLVASPRLR